MAEFHRSHYGPRSLRLVAVGDLDPATLATAVERSFEEVGLVDRSIQRRRNCQRPKPTGKPWSCR
ncbi:MAG: insulinase family protein [Opitutaceae bacterium]|nr:insulinase family protein [Opitutaceae bacterium]